MAELVVCDGAPDVTGLHDIDEYLQAQVWCWRRTTVIFKVGASTARAPCVRISSTSIDFKFEERETDFLLICGYVNKS